MGFPVEQQAAHWIDGEWARSGTRRASITPATGEAFATYFDGGLDEAKNSLPVARRTFIQSDWKVDAMRRATPLSPLADANQKPPQNLTQSTPPATSSLKTN